MKFEDLRKANEARFEIGFTNCRHWNIAEWSNALAGECGELCNLTKKIMRALPKDPTFESAKQDLAHEMADIITYLDILAMRCGINLGEAVKEKFNIVSDRHGLNIKL